MNTEITKQSEAAQVAQMLPPEPDKRALNALSHGLTAEHIPPDERESYAQHVEQVRASTGARNYLEQRLADRAALALWRLDRVARYEAAQAANVKRAALEQIREGEAYGLGKYTAAAYGRLHKRLPWVPVEQLRNSPQVVEDEAQHIETEAAYLLRVAATLRAEGASIDEASTLGEALYTLLSVAGVPARDMVRAMMGRAPKRGEADSVEDREWEYQPEELSGLLALYVELLGDGAAVTLERYAQRRRDEAHTLRALHVEAVSAEADALDVAALPSGDVLDKVTRYEAHLERVLYRALHDLEAARREREGKDTPPPLRGVLDELTPRE